MEHSIVAIRLFVALVLLGTNAFAFGVEKCNKHATILELCLAADRLENQATRALEGDQAAFDGLKDAITVLGDRSKSLTEDAGSRGQVLQ